MERMSQYIDELSLKWMEQNPSVYSASLDYAMLVVAEIKSWYDKDNYKETRTFPKFFVDYDSPSRWQPTPPEYMDGIEPHWNKNHLRPQFILSTPLIANPVPT